jgi:effector-binding domain-containing protein
MRKLIILLGFLCITATVSFAQNKKADKEAAAKAQFEKAVAAIEAKDFVIIVDTYEASDKTVETNTEVTSFISYEKEFVFLQGIPAGNSYTNKVTVLDYNKVVDKKGNIKIVMQCKGSFISAKIEISMKNGGNYATVIISPTKGDAKRFSGEIIPRAESKYFKRPGEV